MFCTLDVRISPEARAFLRTVRHAGGSLHVDHGCLRQLDLAVECARSGLLGFAGGTIGRVPPISRVELTGKAYAYLDRMMRAH